MVHILYDHRLRKQEKKNKNKQKKKYIFVVYSKVYKSGPLKSR